MNRDLQSKWDAMSKEEKLLAFAKAKLAAAEHRDSIPRFKSERSVAHFWYEAQLEFVYGSGKR